jgi:NADPH-dependent 2,4-dienoyl-CoA reductase/sulfur reductase-like enzyme
MTKRRDFLRYAGAAGAMLASAGFSSLGWAGSNTSSTTSNYPGVPANTGIRGRVVVIGGGMAGATVAKYLRLWGGTGIEVTLIERESAYTSSIMSNLVLTGQRTLDSLKFKYDNLVSRYGVQMLFGEVRDIDQTNRFVTLSDGRQQAYDRLVIAPGIQFDTLPGLDSLEAQAKVPHAWKAGEQTTALRNMITAMPGGGVFVMSIPAKPYRCPPGPYERACVVADWLKRYRPGSKVIVLDANPGITAEVHTFTNAFQVTHKDVIEYHPGVQITGVDASVMSVTTNIGTIKGNVLNLIPPHRAGKVITANNLADVEGKWTSVNVLSYEAISAPKIHVIGDASATAQPKAGHIANQEAKVCADAITRLLAGKEPDPAPITNSACYSPITASTASWLTAVYAYDSTSRGMKVVAGSSGEASAPNGDNFEDMSKWFKTLMNDSFA